MRGKQALNARYAGTVGITPAHAGKTFFQFAQFICPPDHPRACGENAAIGCHRVNFRGSPPRMRGKLRACLAVAQGRRITPAHAGKTAEVDANERAFRDHPRACGENRRIQACRFRLKGSPPRMRGKLDQLHCRAQCAGITPAHAGKTAICPEYEPGKEDHPRACGENTRLYSNRQIR